MNVKVLRILMYFGQNKCHLNGTNYSNQIIDFNQISEEFSANLEISSKTEKNTEVFMEQPSLMLDWSETLVHVHTSLNIKFIYFPK